jgi:alpha-glucosidase
MGDESAWAKTGSGEWYLHRFTCHQPDLDWRNELVREHFCKVIKRWVGDQDVDGIRFDTLDHILHDEHLRDFEPIASPASLYHMDRWDWRARYLLEDDAVKLARRLSDAVHEGAEDTVSIAEIYYNNQVREFKHYTRFATEARVDLPFNFSLLETVRGSRANGRELKEVVDAYLKALPPGLCPNFVLSNHDQTARLIDVVGSACIRPLLVVLLCLGDCGGSNIFLYNGDEIGMEKDNVIIESNMDDPIGKMRGLVWSRDHVRTGFVWDSTKINSGYSNNSSPWLPAGKTASGAGAEEQMADPESLCCLTKDLVALRRVSEALCFGEYVPYISDDDTLFCFGRELSDGDGQTLLVIANFSSDQKFIQFTPELRGDIVLSSLPDREHEHVATRVYMNPHEGCIIRLVRPHT